MTSDFTSGDEKRSWVLAPRGMRDTSDSAAWWRSGSEGAVREVVALGGEEHELADPPGPDAGGEAHVPGGGEEGLVPAPVGGGSVRARFSAGSVCRLEALVPVHVPGAVPVGVPKETALPDDAQVGVAEIVVAEGGGIEVQGADVPADDPVGAEGLAAGAASGGCAAGEAPRERDKMGNACNKRLENESECEQRGGWVLGL